MSTLTFEIEDDAVIRALHETKSDIEHYITLVAEDLALMAEQEGGRYSSRLAKRWDIEGIGPTERRVEAPEWWAHFVAGGTKAHGPRTAQKLVFSVDGNVIFADWVSGTPATHFDDRAVDRTKSHLDEILRRVIE